MPEREISQSTVEMIECVDSLDTGPECVYIYKQEINFKHFRRHAVTFADSVQSRRRLRKTVTSPTMRASGLKFESKP